MESRKAHIYFGDDVLLERLRKLARVRGTSVSALALAAIVSSIDELEKNVPEQAKFKLNGKWIVF